MPKNPVFLRRAEVQRVTGLPVSTLYELIARDKFPKPVRITAGRVGWLEGEILEWQRARIAERDSTEAA